MFEGLGGDADLAIDELLNDHPSEEGANPKPKHHHRKLTSGGGGGSHHHRRADDSDNGHAETMQLIAEMDDEERNEKRKRPRHSPSKQRESHSVVESVSSAGDESNHANEQANKRPKPQKQAASGTAESSGHRGAAAARPPAGPSEGRNRQQHGHAEAGEDMEAGEEGLQEGQQLLEESQAAEPYVPCVHPIMATEKMEMYDFSVRCGFQMDGIDKRYWCFLCDEPETDESRQMTQFINERAMNASFVTLAKNVCDIYRKYQEKINQIILFMQQQKPGERNRTQLPPWSPYAVYQHITEHQSSLDLEYARLSRDMIRSASTVYRFQVHRKPREMSELNDHNIPTSAVTVDKDSLALFEKMVRAFTLLQHSKESSDKAKSGNRKMDNLLPANAATGRGSAAAVAATASYSSSSAPRVERRGRPTAAAAAESAPASAARQDSGRPAAAAAASGDPRHGAAPSRYPTHDGRDDQSDDGLSGDDQRAHAIPPAAAHATAPRQHPTSGGHRSDARRDTSGDIVDGDTDVIADGATSGAIDTVPRSSDRAPGTPGGTGGGRRSAYSSTSDGSSRFNFFGDR